MFVHAGRHEDFTSANAGAIANVGFVVGNEAVAVIDTGGSRSGGERLLAAIRAVTDRPIAYVVNTHAHPDHVFGNAAFVETGAAFVGHRRLPAAMAERGPLYAANMRRLLGDSFAGSTIVPPSVVVEDERVLDLGDRTLRLTAWPTAHTDADLTVLDEATGTLFAGDLVFLERIPVVDGSLNGWLAVMDDLAALPADRVVAGHGPPSAAWPDALEAQRRYLERLRSDVRSALAKGAGLDDTVEGLPPPASAWLLGTANHPRNVVAAYVELEWE